jgi:hypothetical protein
MRISAEIIETNLLKSSPKPGALQRMMASESEGLKPFTGKEFYE